MTALEITPAPKGRPRAYQRLLMIQHHYRGEGTFIRCLKLAESIANSRRHVTILCVQQQVGFRRITEESDSANPYVRLVCVPRLTHDLGFLSLGYRCLCIFYYLCRDRNFDLYHIYALGHPANSIPFYFFQRVFRPRARVLVDWDDLWGHGFGRFTFGLMNRLMVFCERRIPFLLGAKAITTASSRLETLAREMGFTPQQTHLIINGANRSCRPKNAPPHYQRLLGLPEGFIYCCSVGHTYLQSLENLLKAFQMAAIEQENLKLIMVGKFQKSGKMGKFLENIIARYSDLFTNHIILTGEVDYEKMRDYVFASQFVLLPMENSQIDICRFPIRFGDYLSTGQIIVSNAIGEIERVMREDNIGLLARVDDLQEFSNMIITASRMSQAEKVKVAERLEVLVQQKYDWKQIAKTLDRVYDSYLGEVDNDESSRSDTNADRH